MNLCSCLVITTAKDFHFLAKEIKDCCQSGLHVKVYGGGEGAAIQKYQGALVLI